MPGPRLPCGKRLHAAGDSPTPPPHRMFALPDKTAIGEGITRGLQFGLRSPRSEPSDHRQSKRSAQVRTLTGDPELSGEQLESVLGATPHDFESRILRHCSHRAALRRFAALVVLSLCPQGVPRGVPRPPERIGELRGDILERGLQYMAVPRSNTRAGQQHSSERILADRGRAEGWSGDSRPDHFPRFDQRGRHTRAALFEPGGLTRKQTARAR
jgi:hypothetical protein